MEASRGRRVLLPASSPLCRLSTAGVWMTIARPLRPWDNRGSRASLPGGQAGSSSERRMDGAVGGLSTGTRLQMDPRMDAGSGPSRARASSPGGAVPENETSALGRRLDTAAMSSSWLLCLRGYD